MHRNRSSFSCTSHGSKECFYYSGQGTWYVRGQGQLAFSNSNLFLGLDHRGLDHMPSLQNTFLHLGNARQQLCLIFVVQREHCVANKYMHLQVLVVRVLAVLVGQVCASMPHKCVCMCVCSHRDTLQLM
jgi:hypothetical protein